MSKVFDAEELVSSAQEHMRGGDVVEPDVALAKLNRAIAANPAYAKAYYLRAVVEEYLGDRASALADLDMAVTLEPNDSKQLYLRGGFRMREGRHDEALDDFRRAAELEPNAADAFIQMGVAAGAMGHFDKAADHFGQALARNPASASIYALRAKALQTIGRNEEAMHDLTQAVSLAPGVPEHRLNRALLARTLGDEARAKDDLEQALFLMPDSNGIRLALSRFLSTSTDPAVRDPKRALKLVDVVVAMRGSVSAETYDARAMALAAQGDYAAAAQAQTNALKLLDETVNPHQAKAYRERLAAYQQGRPTPAEGSGAENSGARENDTEQEAAAP